MMSSSLQNTTITEGNRVSNIIGFNWSQDNCLERKGGGGGGNHTSLIDKFPM